MGQKAGSQVALSTGFAPLARADARLLILGTLPGRASLVAQRYYAHPHNAFWPILAACLGFDADAPYAARVAALLAARIAVWDVCDAAERAGSLDSALVRPSIRPNDFSAFFADYGGIARVAFNGATAGALYRSLVAPKLPPEWAGLAQIRLPSTSPAHARMTRAEKQRLWAAALAAI
ncbi:MAG: DNA-deoxyinosine glycosylase [Telmatospirillum sp.]|nr:DNA-deoxyinosine glycosylase [Telmatospirillum sp.]